MSTKIDSIPEDWPTVEFDQNFQVPILDEAKLANHSLINIVNIISILIDLWELDSTPTRISMEISQFKIPTIKGILNAESNPPSYSLIYEECNELHLLLLEWIDENERKAENPKSDSLSTLIEVERMFRWQLRDIKAEILDNVPWREVRADDLIARIQQFFFSIEKNAKGRFQIAFNHPELIPGAYRINFEIQSDRSNLTIPSKLPSSIQDLFANSRKYSPIGAEIQGLLKVSSDLLSFTILDTGMGIPEDELSKVVQFGERASNSQHIKTYGGGWGLTKAFKLCHDYHGKLTLSSALGKGTRIELSIPNHFELFSI